MRWLIVAALLFGVPRSAGAQAPAPPPSETKQRPQAPPASAPAATAKAPAKAPAKAAPQAKAPPPEEKKPSRPFEWDVPGLVSHVDVAGTIEAQGIPMKLHAVDSSWMPPDLFDHFVKQFQKAGFYIPPASGQVPVHGALSLSAVDTERDLVYTVFIRVNPGGKTTKVLLSTSNMGLAKRPEAVAFVPLYPNAREVMTSNVEVGRSVGFAVNATQEEVGGFYRKKLTELGFEEESPGVYFKDRERIDVRMEPRPDGALSVFILGRIGTQDETITNPHKD